MKEITSYIAYSPSTLFHASVVELVYTIVLETIAITGLEVRILSLAQQYPSRLCLQAYQDGALSGCVGNQVILAGLEPGV